MKDFPIHPFACKRVRMTTTTWEKEFFGELNNIQENSFSLVELWPGAKNRQWCRLFHYISLWIIFTELRVSWRNGVNINSERQYKYFFIAFYVSEPVRFCEQQRDELKHSSCLQEVKSSGREKCGHCNLNDLGVSYDSATYISGDLGEVT